jgi:hypothetical protein
MENWEAEIFAYFDRIEEGSWLPLEHPKQLEEIVVEVKVEDR